MKATLHHFPILALLILSACSPKPSAREIALQKRIDALENRIHTLELDRSLTPGTSYSRFPNLRSEALAEAKLTTQKAQWDALQSLPPADRGKTLVALGLAGNNLRELYRSLAAADAEAASFQTSLQPSHPKMIELKQQRDRIQRLVDLETETLMSALETQLEVSTKWVEAMKKPSTPLP